ncbi:Biotin carboxylase [Actinopolyspora xinjiangensis]|uniref:Biotin carboxylase n=1 Tax=Actinopolyspora xinjiangensis TaxID=405564 RepID=A0A1H0X1T0_9ACTN|nr:ATP-grasp domain-containing protein [Actinopolyspora xinjiangensis]SDP96901.1 Biotin carboxylase [Actinopolyspora xinjiangensis]
MTETVLLVGGGAMTEGYLRAADAAGVRMGVVDSLTRCKELADKYSCVIDTESIDGPAGRDETWLAPAMTLAERLRPDGVLGFAEPHILAAAMVQHRLGVPGPGLDAVVVSRNKALQRAEFARAGIPHPDYLLAPRLSEVTDWVLPNLPVVIKPLSHQGSRGVERIDTAAAWTQAATDRAAEGVLLVERYVDGAEYSVEALVHAGEVLFTNLTRKETTEAPNFVETLHEAGYAKTAPALAETARKLCTDVVNALRIQTGIVHLEFRASDEQNSVIMEVAVRTPGDHILEVASLAVESDLYAAILCLALGGKPNLPDTAPRRTAGTVYLAADQSGTLESLDLQDWSTFPEVIRSYALQEPGSLVGPPVSSEDRLAYAVVNCASHDDLLSVSTRLRSCAQQIIKP